MTCSAAHILGVYKYHFLIFLMLAPRRGALLSYSFKQCFTSAFTINYLWTRCLNPLLCDVIAESMTSSSLCDLHWPQVRTTLPAFFGLSFLVSRPLPLPPSSRSGVHWLRFVILPPMTSCVCEFAWRHSKGRLQIREKITNFHSCSSFPASQKNGNIWVRTLDLEQGLLCHEIDVLDR